MRRGERNLYLEERVAIVLKRLNEDLARGDYGRADLKAFALDCIDVLNGRTGTLTADERERFGVRQ